MDFAIRAGVPAWVALLFVAVILEDDGGPRHDLQIVAPPEVEPGRVLPVRAILLAGMQETETPRLLPVRGEARIEDAAGRVLASKAFPARSRAAGELNLIAPARQDASLRLVVEAETPDGRMMARKPLRVVAAATPLPQSERRLPLLQTFHAFEPRSTGDAPIPSPFEVRVVGSACVPEEPCELLVWVGSPKAQVFVEPSAAVEPVVGVGPETSGIVPLTVRVRGPEAEAVVVAMREGAEVARRPVRLPVVQGAPVLRIETPLIEELARPVLEVAGGIEDAIHLRAFRDGRWERTVSMDAEAVRGGTVAFPVLALDRGAWRLEVTPDLFPTDRLASRNVWVYAPGQSEREALHEAAAYQKARGRETEFATAVLEGRLEGTHPALTLAFLFAADEAEVPVLPAAVSGRLQALEARSDSLDVRRLGAMGIVFAGLFVSGILLFRARAAEREARRLALLEPTSDAVPSTGGMGRAVGAAFFLLLVFGAVALLVMSRTGS